MKAVIYARYSSDNQTEASIEGQLRECMEFAEHAEIDVVGQYIDRALSAKTDNRPEFQKMIKDSYKHAFDCIIVWKLDRFARNRYDSAHYKSLLKKNGAHMVGESGMGTSKVYRYYKCYNTKKVHTCDKKPVRKEWIEDLAIKSALDILQNNEVIDYLTDKIYALQGEENPRILKLKAQLGDVEKRLANIMQAIEQGIIFDTTKERFAALESEKKELEIAILQEKIKKPFLTKEQIRFGIEKFRQLDVSSLEGKQRLIDAFINAIYLYDDKITFAFNYKDGTRTVMLSELTDGKNNSDLKCQGAPSKKDRQKPILFTWLQSEIILEPAGNSGEALRSASGGASLMALSAIYNPNCLLVTSEWFGFTLYIEDLEYF